MNMMRVLQAEMEDKEARKEIQVAETEEKKSAAQSKEAEAAATDAKTKEAHDKAAAEMAEQKLKSVTEIENQKVESSLVRLG